MPGGMVTGDVVIPDITVPSGQVTEKGLESVPLVIASDVISGLADVDSDVVCSAVVGGVVVGGVVVGGGVVGRVVAVVAGAAVSVVGLVEGPGRVTGRILGEDVLDPGSEGMMVHIGSSQTLTI